MGSTLDKRSSQVRKQIEDHIFDDEEGDEYGGSEFGGFGDYFRRKKIKLQNLDSELQASASNKPQIFKGVVAHVSGYTQPALHVLHRDLVQHGAGFLQYLDGKTMATHIIASALTPKKIVEFSRYRIVKPAWVVESIKAGKLLPWSDFRVIDEGPRQNILTFQDGRMKSQSSSRPNLGYREQTENSFYNSQFPKSGPTNGQSRTDSFPSEVKKQTVTTSPGLGDSHHILTDVGIPAKEPTSIRPPEPPKNVSPEEHNAWLLSDPKTRESSSANPDFLRKFYSESRLHHLSTWKAELKSQMQRMAAEKAPSEKMVKRKPSSRRYIMHVDFDSFFCAVSLKQYPEYKDKPAVVAHGSGAGCEIASCNYPSRHFGVKNGMWMRRALELCPDIKILPYDFPAYEEMSRRFYGAIIDVGGVVQSVSIDEALVDITTLVLESAKSDGENPDEGCIWRERTSADELARDLRDQILKLTGCSVSVGIGGNILQAKVALRKAKPAGQYQVKSEEVLDLLGDLEVKDLPGVAYSLSSKLEDIGAKFVKDIRQLSKERLSTTLGPKTGERLWEYSRGIDRTEVGEQPPRKSVSAEINWGIRFTSQEEAEEFVLNLCRELERRLLNEQVKGRSFTMKIMRRALDAPLDPTKHLGHGKCDTFTKSTIFGVSTNDAKTISREAVAILRSYKFSPGDLRGLGVQLTKLERIKDGLPEGSQRKLVFPGITASTKRSGTDPIEDGEASSHARQSPASRDIATDPIAIDPITPQKPKSTPTRHALALAKAAKEDDHTMTPLNLGGTQFILPSNPDLAVISELPPDIRTRLLAHGRRQEKRNLPPRQSPTSSSMNNGALPPDVDPEVFYALPDEIKKEILASYGGSGSVTPTPQPDAIAQGSRPAAVSEMMQAAKHVTENGTRPKLQLHGLSKSSESEIAVRGEERGELDESFLQELPEDIRREVLEDHLRRQRLALKPGHHPHAPARQINDLDGDAVLPGGQTKLAFPAPPPRITFGDSGPNKFEDVKSRLEIWFSDTRLVGPHRGDVESLGRYLTQVILEEKNMEKAVKLVRWLEWMVEAAEESKGRVVWRKHLGDIKASVQTAARERGLGRLAL